MYHGKTGFVLGEQKSCTHLSTEKVHHTLLPYQTDGKEYLLEGCTGCTVIRVYECPLNSAPISQFPITPRLMCKGPQGTILVLDETNKIIAKYSFMRNIQYRRDLDFNETTRVHAMRYSDKHDLIIVLDGYAIKRFHPETGEVVCRAFVSTRPQTC